MPPQTAMSLHLAVSKDDAFTAAMLILEGADVNRFHLTWMYPIGHRRRQGQLADGEDAPREGREARRVPARDCGQPQAYGVEAWLRQEMLAHLLEGSSGGEDESEDGADDVTDLLNEEDDDDSDDEEELQRPRWYSES